MNTSVAHRIFSSSKNIMMLAGVIFAIAARVGFGLEMELVVSVLTLVAIAIGARAYEDGSAKAAQVIRTPEETKE